MPKSNQIIFIVGPTAVGKSDIAFYLAKRINGEIISCDSMQVYKDIAIASNKPAPEMLKKIPHHLIGIIDVKARFDVAAFNDLANQAVEKIFAKKKTPIVVGGSGLYMEILLDGIFDQGKTDRGLRKQIEQEIEDKGIEAAYEELKLKDPDAAKKIHLNDRRRIVRALEIIRSTGKSASEIGKNRQGWWGQYDVRIFGLNTERKKLYERIEARADQMFNAGLVDEIKALRSKNLSLTVQGLIGIKEVLGYLNGEYDLERAKYLLKLNTRHLAKKQLTWFRAEKRIQWLDIKPEISLGQTAEDILHLLKKKA